MKNEHRSGCPINLTAEELGNRWNLVILRDIVVGNRRSFSELLRNSQEGIATNILGSRLSDLVERGYLTQRADPSHKQRVFYSLTEKAIQLVPVFAVIGAWGSKHLPVTEELSIRALILEQGGPPMWARFMDELRADHLPGKPTTSSVRAELQAAYEKAARGSS
jgi:DNA-binding HxlR family transcriptional regulator